MVFSIDKGLFSSMRLASGLLIEIMKCPRKVCFCVPEFLDRLRLEAMTEERALALAEALEERARHIRVFVNCQKLSNQPSVGN